MINFQQRKLCNYTQRFFQDTLSHNILIEYLIIGLSLVSFNIPKRAVYTEYLI